MGYKVVIPEQPAVPQIVPDLDGGTTSWRDAKKFLRSWYLEQAAALRSISEKDYFEQ